MNTFPGFGLAKTAALTFAVSLWFMDVSTGRADSPVLLSVSVTQVSGNVRYNPDYRMASVGWEALQPGTKLGEGSVVETGFNNSTVDIRLGGSDTNGQGAVHIFSNSVVRLIRLGSKAADLRQIRDIELGVLLGKARLSLDRSFQCDIQLGCGQVQLRVEVRQQDAGDEQAVLLFDAGTLSVLKGTVQVAVGKGPQQMLHAGEQIQRDSAQVTKMPRKASGSP
jgi:hypothetical protein